MENSSYKLWMYGAGVEIRDTVRIIRIIWVDPCPPEWNSVHYLKWKHLKEKKQRNLRKVNRLWIVPLCVTSLLAGITLSALCAWWTKFPYLGLWGGMITGPANLLLYQNLRDKYKL